MNFLILNFKHLAAGLNREFPHAELSTFCNLKFFIFSRQNLELLNFEFSSITLMHDQSRQANFNTKHRFEIAN